MTDESLIVAERTSSARLAGEWELPVLPLVNNVLFPQSLAPLFVGHEQSQAALDAALTSDRIVLAVARRNDEHDIVAAADLYSVGVEAHVSRVVKQPDGTLNILLRGLRRVQIVAVLQDRPLLLARTSALHERVVDTPELEAMRRVVLSIFEQVTELSGTLPEHAYLAALNAETPGALADLIATNLPLRVAKRQQVLEMLDIAERLRLVLQLLKQELDILQMEHQVRSVVERAVDRSQREAFLREQLKAIQHELGQDDPQCHEVAALRERIESAQLPEATERRAKEELQRLEVVAPGSPEFAVVRNYLHWLLDVPWSSTTDDSIDLRSAIAVLDQHHYGLAKVKERVIEHLAVRKLAGSATRPPILCFVGPPGVGKTSLGRAIAAALGRRFVRVSLGGIHDEAEVRGHRRTYVGAMPGRIIKAMKEAGSTNPVFMLDEIDKIGQDFRGDPAAALLEVLDPEQNHSFSDHYLDAPYDLSRVLFITTANVLDPIHDALLDRFEVIELPGYTEDEKIAIAQRFLIPRQLAMNGVADVSVRFAKATLQQLVRLYTFEAGVRNLEREIGAICRKIARRVAEDQPYPRRIQPSLLQPMLGAPRYDYGLAEVRDEAGVATGLVWSEQGGDVMAVEISVVEGKGNLTLTGQLGDIMQESAQAALSYIRANAKRLGVNPRGFDKVDIHIHVPEGGVPKDGPSAGITLACALLSALTGLPTRRAVAMTGEITLRGHVLPVGGVKEKILGAYRAGITDVILPRKNARELDEELPRDVKRKLRFVFVDTLDDVLPVAFVENPLDHPYRARQRRQPAPAKVLADS